MENNIIPKTIWQTYKTKYQDLPDYAKEYTESWKNLNKEYLYNYVSDEDALDFIKDNYGQSWLDIFNSVPLGVMRGDILRYLLIYKNGGVYADLDTLCLKPIDSWIVKDKEIIFGPESSLEFCVWTFASVANHPIIENVLIRMEKAFENPDYNKAHFVHRLTGPWALTKAIFHKINYASLDIPKDFDKINNSDGAMKYNMYCYGGSNEKIFQEDAVKHVFGSQVWTDGSYDQWIEDPLTKEYINTVDLRKMFFEEEIDYMHLLDKNDE